MTWHGIDTPGGEAIEPIRKEFGEEFIQPDGAMNRSLMRELVVSRADERLKLEAVSHPLIRKVSIEQAEGGYRDLRHICHSAIGRVADMAWNGDEDSGSRLSGRVTDRTCHETK